MPSADACAVNADALSNKLVEKRTFLELVEEAASDDDALRAHSAPPAIAKGEVREHRTVPSPQGEDQNKTTVIIQHIPRAYTRAAFLELLDKEGFFCQYDFAYLPMDFSGEEGNNFGYAFVNFTGPRAAQRCMAQFTGFSSWGMTCAQAADVGWGESQGLTRHVERFRNSPVMHESVADECKPVLLEKGVRVEFPPSTKKISVTRRLRTRHGGGRAGGPCAAPGEGCGASAAEETGDGFQWADGELDWDYQGTDEELQPTKPRQPCVSPASFKGPSLSTTPLMAGLYAVGVEKKTGATSWLRRARTHQDSMEVDSQCSTTASSRGSRCSTAASSSGGHSLGSAKSLDSGASRFSRQNPADSILANGLALDSPLASGLSPIHGSAADGSSISEGTCKSWPESAHLQRSSSKSKMLEPGSVVELVGIYPSGERAIILAAYPDCKTYDVRLLTNGLVKGNAKTIHAKHARLVGTPQ